MIKSCTDCKTKCCKTGPGPYKIRKVDTYLDNFGTPENYNTKCEHFTRSGKCRVWGTRDLPLECRTYVCTNRQYSKKEMDVIKQTDDWNSCGKCKTPYARFLGGKKWKWECVNCGHKWSWKLIEG